MCPHACKRSDTCTPSTHMWKWWKKKIVLNPTERIPITHTITQSLRTVFPTICEHTNGRESSVHWEGWSFRLAFSKCPWLCMPHKWADAPTSFSQFLSRQNCVVEGHWSRGGMEGRALGGSGGPGWWWGAQVGVEHQSGGMGQSILVKVKMQPGTRQVLVNTCWMCLASWGLFLHYTSSSLSISPALQDDSFQKQPRPPTLLHARPPPPGAHTSLFRKLPDLSPPAHQTGDESLFMSPRS